MKFRTEVEIEPFGHKLNYGSRLLTLGSCFADNIAAALQAAKLNVTANPAGVLFNPASIARIIEIFNSGTRVEAGELTHSGERCFDYRFHGSLSGRDERETLDKINRAIAVGAEALRNADTVAITFGTAWIYTLNATGETVANCHKQPASLFTRKRLTATEIVDEYSRLLQTVLKGKRVIFTVSPVRHTGDGADGNFLSKATLKLAVAELTKRFDNADYFPAYEILNDDLRDYRFYADDLVHPSAQAVAYIREKFFAAALDRRTLELLPQVERITAAAAHRPTDAGSAEHRAFCRSVLEQIERLERQDGAPDLSVERERFESMLQ